MGTVCLYYGCSLDGFIEGENGDMSWLPDGHDFGYAGFYGTVKATVMGRLTYEKVMSFGGEWHYPTSHNYLISSTINKPIAHIELINKSICDFISDLKEKTDGRIWIVGGPTLHIEVLEANLVDEIILTVIPALVGSGVRFLDKPGFKPQTWELKEVIPFEKAGVQTIYVRK